MLMPINVTAAIIIKANKIFAARRKQGIDLGGYWELPGGKLEAGETPEECLARELYEELKITVRVGAFIGENTHDYGAKQIRLMAYAVEHIEGEFKLSDHDEIRWLSWNELDQINWAAADVPLIEQYKAHALTSAYYENNAKSYCNETLRLDMGDIYAPFLSSLSYPAHILDLGCGSGRDTKAFLEKKYVVTAIDGNTAIAALAEEVIGQRVIVKSFNEITFEEEFDGVWACASLLHCNYHQLLNVLDRIVRALKSGGTLYLSFKWGHQETVDEFGRHYSNFTDVTLRELLLKVDGLVIIDIWSTISHIREDEQTWVNALVKKI